MPLFALMLKKEGTSETLNALGGVDNFFSLRMNKKNDIYGIAMTEFFEKNNIVDMVYKKAQSGHKVRIFADHGSQELKNQELIENKPCELKSNIERNTKNLKGKFKSNKKLQNRFKFTM